MKKLFSLLLALMLVFSLALPAFASGGSITYKGSTRIYVTPGKEAWTDSDMFGNFKNVMPGDVLEETVKITNLAVDCHYVQVNFQAVAHDATNQPSRKVTGAGETLVSMNAFLSKLHLEVKRGDSVIYSGPANTETDDIAIKALGPFKTLELTATLTVPKELGNEYAHREGEVDWVFTFREGYYNDDEAAKTGDYILIAVAVLAVSALSLVLIFGIRKRKRR